MDNTNKISISNKDETNYIRNRLIEFNAEHVPSDINTNYEDINLSIKDENGKIIGGLISVFCWNWLEVDILWIDQKYRGLGYGSNLLQEIEEIAKHKGCTFIKLNTFSFQAPDFYKKQGYTVIGVLDDAPRGFKHYYFKKDIRE
ncbi:GNAT family N-acetyltransferase [Paenibacillus sp. sgz500958]|uniref:GNAT family N-acetyltransferase n=1 Tax=Paenibacillus sp. sgz500958 TaxID=3242475 RepID=UPI0036D3BB1E